jgi:hypothetical protein
LNKVEDRVKYPPGPDPEILAAITTALDALNQVQPAIILEITAAIQAPGGGRKKDGKR